MNTQLQPTNRIPLLTGLIVTLLISMTYLAVMRNQGWIGHDEGLLAHSADRVLDGEIPHLDFQEVYTGGLSYLHALVLKILGVDLTSLRTGLVMTAGLAVCAWYFITARFLPPIGASLTTLLCVSWSFPNYFAAMPSWYNLMFASWSIWALLNYSDALKQRYLWIAGLTTGLSILCKIVGLYALAASLFAILFIHLSHASKPDTRPDKRLTATVALLSSVYGLMLLLLVAGQLALTTITLFVLPGWLLMGMAFKQSQLADWQAASVLRIFKDMMLLVTATLIPIALFCIPYLTGNSMGQLLLGLFELPKARFEHTVYLPPAIGWFCLSIPIGLLLFRDYKIPGELRFPLNLVILLVGILIVVVGSNRDVYTVVFRSVQLSLPVIVVVGVAMLVKIRTAANGRPARNRLFILLMFATAMSLIQYPYSSGIYYCYCSPFSILAVAAIVGRPTKHYHLLWVNLAVFLGTFAVCWMHFSNPRTIGILYQDNNNHTLLDLPRGGLQIAYQNYRETKPLVDFIQRHTAADEYILAGPDCPQFYFLTDRKNPTRHFYDLFEKRVLGSQQELEEELKSVINKRDIKLMVLNTKPEFSAPYSADFRNWLQQWGQPVYLNSARRFVIVQRN